MNEHFTICQSATGRQSDSDSDSEVGHHVSSQIVASNFDDFDDDDELGVTQQVLLPLHASNKTNQFDHVTVLTGTPAARQIQIAGCI
jgi:D-serine deaminase-like pyridoxal phosphate-dependent protein